MALTTYLCAWSNVRDAGGYLSLHEGAYRELAYLEMRLDDYRVEKGKYPERLADLKKHEADRSFDDLGNVPDPWGNPFQYHAGVDGYTLYSFGPDGKRGGETFDRDLDVTDLSSIEGRGGKLPPGSSPSLWQFTFECPTRGIRLASALTGICAFLACMFTLKAGQANLARSLIGLILTLLACLWFGVIIGTIHVSSNH